MLVEPGEVAVDSGADAAEQPAGVAGDLLSDFEGPDDRWAYPPAMRCTEPSWDWWRL
jgi:hypothetical protein